MIKLDEGIDKRKIIPKFASLNKKLTIWLTLLAILPLIIVSTTSYYISQKSLGKAAKAELIQSSYVTSQSIKSWFSYRLMDLEIIAESSATTNMISSLKEGFSKSQRPLKTYISSYDWTVRAAPYINDLKTLRLRYDYIADIYLIDCDGNIIFNLSKEPDLGSNLFSASLKNYEFTKSVKKTLASGQTSFSGLEKYPLSSAPNASFLTAPITDANGDKIGVIALQIQFDRIYHLLRTDLLQSTSREHFLISQAGELLSPFGENHELILAVENKHTAEHLLHHTNSSNTPSGPDTSAVIVDQESTRSLIEHQVISVDQGHSDPVFSAQTNINLADKTWILVSEVHKNEALADAVVLRNTMLLISLFSTLVIVLIAASLARKISRPISALSKISLKIAQGENISRVNIDTNDEIGQLSDAFNHMLTVRRLHEKELQKSSDQARKALDDLAEQSFALDQHALLLITDLNCDITYANEKFTQTSGYTNEELIGKNLLMMAAEDQGECFLNEIHNTIHQGNVWSGEVEKKAKDGSTYWLDSTIVPFTDSTGQPKSFIFISTDICRRKMVEAEVNKTLALLGSISETTDNGILVTSRAGKILWINKRCASIWNLAPELLEDENTGPIRAHIAGQLNEPSRALTLRMSKLPEYHARIDLLYCEDGRVFEQVGQFMDDLSPGDSIWTFRDITKRMQAERAMRSARDAAEDIAKAKSEFLASMSHEIRTPMNGVIGMLRLLQNSQLSELQRSRAIIAQNSAQGLLGLIDDILDFSKVDAGKLKLESINFNLHNLLGELVDGFALSAKEKQIELVLDLVGLERSAVKGDPTRIRQIINNLVGNAIKFTPQGTVVISANVRPEKNNKLELTAQVKDTGIGIQADKLDRLFDTFSQVDASTTRQYGGTGLGLAITQKLCHLMDGDISVTSEEGKGSEFKFHVLLDESDESDSYITSINISKLRILIADGAETSAQVLAAQLSYWGASVTCVNSQQAFSEECQRAWRSPSQLYDVAFVDLDLNNIETQLMDLKTQIESCGIKLVFMTSISDKNPERYDTLGCTHSFHKPATTSDLFDALASVSSDSLTQDQAALASATDTLRVSQNGQFSASHIPQWPRNTKVLLVEDNKVNQMVASGVLASLNLPVELAENGQEAIEKLKHANSGNAFSLIFMDCQMPVMDGYEATSLIRAGHAGELAQYTPIVAMTANAMAGDREKCLSVGMDDYISKPIDTDILLRKLSDWLLGQDQENGREAPLIGADSPTTNTRHKVWDKSALLKRLNHHDDQLKPLIQLFLKDARQLINSLEEQLKQDPLAAQKTAHTLKGTAANMSCEQLRDISQTILNTLKDGLHLGPETTADLSSIWFQTEKQLSAELAQHSTPSEQTLPKVDKTDYTETNLQLIAMLEPFKVPLTHGDYIDADSLDPLTHLEVATDIRQHLDEFIECINRFIFDEALEKLNTIVSLCNASSQD